MLNGKPLCIDGYCGLGGWSEGFLEMGWTVLGFDIEKHSYGNQRYSSRLVLQDMLTVHGSQFKDADCLVMSPPCQNYSYLAMPWSRSSDPENSKAAKALRQKWETEGPDNRLFDACFRIQREAISATGVECPDCDGSGVYEERLADCDKRDWPCEECKGTGAVHTRYIPLIVENVRGAVPWVGKQAASFGSFYLWGDVAQIGNRVVAGRDLADIRAGRGRFGMGVAPVNLAPKRSMDDLKYGVRKMLHDQLPVGTGPLGRNGPGEGVTARKGIGRGETSPDGTGATSWFGKARCDPRDVVNTGNGYVMPDGTKIGGDWFRDPACHSKHGSRSNARKAASAMIAKIPYALSRYIAEQHMPAERSAHA